MPETTNPSKIRLYLVTFSFPDPDGSNPLIYALSCLGSIYEVNENSCILETSHTFSIIALWTFLKNTYLWEDDSLQIFKINKSTMYPQFDENNYPFAEIPYLTDEEYKKVEADTKAFIDKLK